MHIFSSLKVDPIKGGEILDALGVDVDDITNMVVMRRLREICQFFSTKESPGRLIRRIMKPGVDPIEQAWTYAQVQGELSDQIMKIRGFEKEFSEDIAEGLHDDYLTTGLTRGMEKQISSMENKERAEELKGLVDEYKAIKKELEAYGKNSQNKSEEDSYSEP